jgi:hypothetical protein
MTDGNGIFEPDLGDHIQNVRVYERALSPTEVDARFRITQGKWPQKCPGCLRADTKWLLHPGEPRVECSNCEYDLAPLMLKHDEDRN